VCLLKQCPASQVITRVKFSPCTGYESPPPLIYRLVDNVLFKVSHTSTNRCFSWATSHIGFCMQP